MIHENICCVRKPVFGVLRTTISRPACTSVQSDQRLCYSLIGKYHIKTCYEHIFNFLAGLCSRGDWFESRFVRNPEDRFSRQSQSYCSSSILTGSFAWTDNTAVNYCFIQWSPMIHKNIVLFLLHPFRFICMDRQHSSLLLLDTVVSHDSQEYRIVLAPSFQVHLHGQTISSLLLLDTVVFHDSQEYRIVLAPSFQIHLHRQTISSLLLLDTMVSHASRKYILSLFHPFRFICMDR